MHPRDCLHILEEIKIYFKLSVFTLLVHILSIEKSIEQANLSASLPVIDHNLSQKALAFILRNAIMKLIEIFSYPHGAILMGDKSNHNSHGSKNIVKQ